MSEDLTSEEFWVQQERIPGSTRVPIRELKSVLSDRDNQEMVILDLGSGEGRSTRAIKKAFPKAEVVAFDLSHQGLEKTVAEADRVQGTVLELPFSNEAADGVVLCGVMTNITDKEPEKAVEARKKVFEEISRVLKPGGICVISDFSNAHLLTGYPVNYTRHKIITDEYGTIAVFDPMDKISFAGLSDEEVADLSPQVIRLAHHYSPEEMIGLVKSQEDLAVSSYSVERGTTPSGTPIDTLVMVVIKKTV